MTLHAAETRKAVCMICGDDVRFRMPAAADTDAVCESPDCRVILSRRPHVGPHEFRFLIERCRRQRREQERLAERRSREAAENESIRVSTATQEGLPAARYPLVVLPAAPQQLEEPSQDRLQLYREHLSRIIAAAFAGSEDGAPAEQATAIAADPVPFADRFCALCRGGCCSMGRESAYLNADTIRRLRRQRPDLSPEQISAEYLDRVSEQTVAGSCINHTAHGCALPREMRSDTCNAFYCKGLRDWQKNFESDDKPLGAFVIQRGEDNWSQERTDVRHDVVDVSIVTESGVRPLAR